MEISKHPPCNSFSASRESNVAKIHCKMKLLAKFNTNLLRTFSCKKADHFVIIRMQRFHNIFARR